MSAVTREEILKRLPFIFPVGTPNRNHCVSEVAAGAVFTMLSAGAIEGRSVCVNPKQIFRMNEGTRKRPLYLSLSQGLIPAGAVKFLPGVHPNAFKPKYYLEKEFARLFKNKLTNDELAGWQKNHFDEKTFRLITCIQRAAENLPALQNEIFHLTRYEKDYRVEAADKLRLPIRTIDNELKKAIRFIRKQIQNENIPADGKEPVDGPQGPRHARPRCDPENRGFTYESFRFICFPS